ncbi:PREDICTED: regulation of nuclear pre-mRNA domain-containing protein 1A [Tauraco erythrolophus]|uniref:regulation of nuclear pre-mRNA domain-containing protein 1A n=2 Tax=Neoaves TaxID=3078114 RepID=UPI0005238D6A|nr:PREDICTED: regulation of nuclear pre-mRNA domain-containing protein 1A [Tauraco erythrolophus]
MHSVGNLIPLFEKETQQFSNLGNIHQENQILSVHRNQQIPGSSTEEGQNSMKLMGMFLAILMGAQFPMPGAKPNRKLTFLYLANDVIQNSKRKGPEFTKDFAPVIVEAFKHVSSESDESCKKHLGRVLSIWEERSVYENDVLEQLRQALYGDRKVRKRTYEQIKVDENNCSPRSSPTDPPQTTDLIRALQELENAASGDAAVHQRIASLPIEVQDVSLLDRITDKESGEQLSKMVDDACMLLADYNGRLAAEIDDRKQLTRMLSDFLRCQKEFLAEKEHKLEVRNVLF